jgi:hypothetical protein
VIGNELPARIGMAGWRISEQTYVINRI